MHKWPLQNWFLEPGAYVLVDGQFGSTGKGLAASFLAAIGDEKITHVTTNAGPNSGHTAYWITEPDDPSKDKIEHKIVTQQIPVAGVCLTLAGRDVSIELNAGAVIDDETLLNEITKYAPIDIDVHPNAVRIIQQDRDREASNKIAGTAKGVGAAIARKVERDSFTRSIQATSLSSHSWGNRWDWEEDVVLVETAQGFSLGINRQFYPYCTSRECTVAQAVTDASIPVQMVKKVIAVYRTYPIRVGNTPTGYSGDCYPDQKETTWDAIGQFPEFTTVTKRMRRVFTWSRIQFQDSVAANRPDVIFLNFCNYLTIHQLDTLYIQILQDYREVMGRGPEDIMLGFGPRIADIKSATGVF